jgi:hypothetical protein
VDAFAIARSSKLHGRPQARGPCTGYEDGTGEQRFWRPDDDVYIDPIDWRPTERGISILVYGEVRQELIRIDDAALTPAAADYGPPSTAPSATYHRS